MEIKGLRKIEPYVAGSQPAEKNIIKLNTNENAYGPSPAVHQALASFDAHQLRKYSTLDQAALRQALSEQLGVTADQVIIGNGSDDILSMAFLAFFNSEEEVLFPDLTYGFYKVWADLYRIPFREVPLNSSFEIDTQDYLVENGGIVLTNPNAPTGIYKPLDQIEEIVKANQSVVVIIDEAYINFGGETVLPLLEKYDNVFITRTFSKIMATRDWFSQELKAIGFDVLPSKTNFVLVKPHGVTAGQLFDYLQSKKIYVRYFPKVKRISDRLRISIGTQDEMERVLITIQELQA